MELGEKLKLFEIAVKALRVDVVIGADVYSVGEGSVGFSYLSVVFSCFGDRAHIGGGYGKDLPILLDVSVEVSLEGDSDVIPRLGVNVSL